MRVEAVWSMEDGDAQWKSWLEKLIDRIIEDKFLLFIDGYCDKHFDKVGAPEIRSLMLLK